MMRPVSIPLAAAVAFWCSFSPVSAIAAETVRIASMDMSSGGLASFGLAGIQHMQFLAEKASNEQWAGDVLFEIVPFDTKMSPQEALSLLKQVQSQGIRYVVQGASSSAVGMALQEAVERHNSRNPGQEILYLNYASLAPAMTNERCSYWHFRTDAHVDMKIKALMEHLASDAEVRRVFLLNPNYAFGQESSRAAKQFLADLRPDIEIVGDDFHPTGQVKDFSPYIAKIMRADADALVTVSFGNDLALMVRAANDMGMKDTRILTVAANSPGLGLSFGSSAEGNVFLVGMSNMNDNRYGATELARAYRERMGGDFFFGATESAMRLLAAAIKEAGSTEPSAVAAQMSGMTVHTVFGPVVMRAQDHQLQMPLAIDVWTKVDGEHVVIDQDGTAYGWRTHTIVAKEQASLPTTCQMTRP